VSPAGAVPEHGARAVAAPENPETPRASDRPAREERAPVKKDSVPAEDPGGGSTVGPRHPPETRTALPREEPKNTPGTGPAAPAPPTPVPPPASVPPLPAAPPPIDPLPDPVSLTPKAQLDAIAAELREIAGTHDDDGGRVGQAVEKVESAVARLEKTPPDNQGAIGDIKNAVQKLDAALAEGEINVAERTLFVTRLNAVSQELKGAP
jgi:hypothetical protein